LFRTGTKVGLLLDCDERTLAVYVDGTLKGTAFANLPAGVTLYPVIGVGCLDPNAYSTDFMAKEPSFGRAAFGTGRLVRAAGDGGSGHTANFQFDPEFASQYLTLSPEHDKIVAVSASGKRSARIGPALGSGKHSVTFSIERSSSGSSLGACYFVGFVSGAFADFDSAGLSDGSNSVGLEDDNTSNGLPAFSSANTADGRAYRSHQVLKLEVDFDEGTLSLIREPGTAEERRSVKRGIPFPEVYFCVTVYNEDASCAIIESSTSVAPPTPKPVAAGSGVAVGGGSPTVEWTFGDTTYAATVDVAGWRMDGGYRRFRTGEPRRPFHGRFFSEPHTSQTVSACAFKQCTACVAFEKSLKLSGWDRRHGLAMKLLPGLLAGNELLMPSPVDRHFDTITISGATGDNAEVGNGSWRRTAEHMFNLPVFEKVGGGYWLRALPDGVWGITDEHGQHGQHGQHGETNSAASLDAAATNIGKGAVASTSGEPAAEGEGRFKCPNCRTISARLIKFFGVSEKCKICMELDMDCMFEACKHVVTCHRCALQLQESDASDGGGAAAADATGAAGGKVVESTRVWWASVCPTSSFPPVMWQVCSGPTAMAPPLREGALQLRAKPDGAGAAEVAGSWQQPSPEILVEWSSHEETKLQHQQETESAVVLIGGCTITKANGYYRCAAKRHNGKLLYVKHGNDPQSQVFLFYSTAGFWVVGDGTASTHNVASHLARSRGLDGIRTPPLKEWMVQQRSQWVADLSLVTNHLSKVELSRRIFAAEAAAAAITISGAVGDNATSINGTYVSADWRHNGHALYVRTDSKFANVHLRYTGDSVWAIATARDVEGGFEYTEPIAIAEDPEQLLTPPASLWKVCDAADGAAGVLIPHGLKVAVAATAALSKECNLYLRTVGGRRAYCGGSGGGPGAVHPKQNSGRDAAGGNTFAATLFCGGIITDRFGDAEKAPESTLEAEMVVFSKPASHDSVVLRVSSTDMQLRPAEMKACVFRRQTSSEGGSLAHNLRSDEPIVLVSSSDLVVDRLRQSGDAARRILKLSKPARLLAGQFVGIMRQRAKRPQASTGSSGRSDAAFPLRLHGGSKREQGDVLFTSSLDDVEKCCGGAPTSLRGSLHQDNVANNTQRGLCLSFEVVVGKCYGPPTRPLVAPRLEGGNRGVDDADPADEGSVSGPTDQLNADTEAFTATMEDYARVLSRMSAVGAGIFDGFVVDAKTTCEPSSSGAQCPDCKLLQQGLALQKMVGAGATFAQVPLRALGGVDGRTGSSVASISQAADAVRFVQGAALVGIGRSMAATETSEPEEHAAASRLLGKVGVVLEGKDSYDPKSGAVTVTFTDGQRASLPGTRLVNALGESVLGSAGMAHTIVHCLGSEPHRSWELAAPWHAELTHSPDGRLLFVHDGAGEFKLYDMLHPQTDPRTIHVACATGHSMRKCWAAAEYVCSQCEGSSSAGHRGGSKLRWRCEACSEDTCLNCTSTPGKRNWEWGAHDEESMTVTGESLAVKKTASHPDYSIAVGSEVLRGSKYSACTWEMKFDGDTDGVWLGVTSPGVACNQLITSQAASAWYWRPSGDYAARERGSPADERRGDGWNSGDSLRFTLDFDAGTISFANVTPGRSSTVSRMVLNGVDGDVVPFVCFDYVSSQVTITSQSATLGRANSRPKTTSPGWVPTSTTQALPKLVCAGPVFTRAAFGPSGGQVQAQFSADSLTLVLSSSSLRAVRTLQVGDGAAAPEPSTGRPRVGGKVSLASGYADHSDASGGPLAPGDVGELVVDDGSGKPFKVRANNGKSWWYNAEAIQSAGPAAGAAAARSLGAAVNTVLVSPPSWDGDASGAPCSLHPHMRREICHAAHSGDRQPLPVACGLCNRWMDPGESRYQCKHIDVKVFEIQGATGVLASKVNGTYEKTSEIKNGKPVFAKVGSDGTLVCWYLPHKVWAVTQAVKTYDRSICAYAVTSTVGLPHPIVADEKWSVCVGEAANVALAGRPAVGDKVTLTSGYADHSDAGDGPLAPGEEGELVEDDGSGKPFKVRANTGKSWWYNAEAIQKGSLFQMESQPSIVATSLAGPTAAGRPTVGGMVSLASGYADHSDASGGPLAPGDVGELVEDDGSGKPFKVRANNGKSWWYNAEAIQSSTGTARCQQGQMCTSCFERVQFTEAGAFNVQLSGEVGSERLVIHNWSASAEPAPAPLCVNVYDLSAVPARCLSKHTLFEDPPGSTITNVEFVGPERLHVTIQKTRKGVTEYYTVDLAHRTWVPLGWATRRLLRVTVNRDADSPKYAGRTGIVVGGAASSTSTESMVLLDGDAAAVPIETAELGADTCAPLTVRCQRVLDHGKRYMDPAGRRFAVTERDAESNAFSVRVFEQASLSDDFVELDAELKGIHLAEPSVLWSPDGRLLVTVESSQSENRVNLFRAEGKGKYPLLETHTFEEDEITATWITGRPFVAVKSNKRMGTVYILDTTALVGMGAQPTVGPGSLDRMIKYDMGLGSGLHNTATLFDSVPDLGNQCLTLHWHQDKEAKDVTVADLDVAASQATTLLGYAALRGHSNVVQIMLNTFKDGFQLPSIGGATALQCAISTGVSTQPLLDMLIKSKQNAAQRLAGEGDPGVCLEPFPAGTTLVEELCELAKTRPGQVASFLSRFGFTPAHHTVLGGQQLSIAQVRKSFITAGSSELAPAGLWHAVVDGPGPLKKGPIVVSAHVIGIPGFSAHSLGTDEDGVPFDDIRTSLLHRFTQIADSEGASELFKPDIVQALVGFKWQEYG
jgi:hypothetical protein